MIAYYSYRTGDYCLEPGFKKEFLFQAIFRKDLYTLYGTYKEPTQQILNLIHSNTKYFFPSINLTYADIFFEDYNKLVKGLEEREIYVINKNYIDISKSTLHNKLKQQGLLTTAVDKKFLEQSTDSKEQIIVKTNYNYYGVPEKQFAKEYLPSFLQNHLKIAYLDSNYSINSFEKSYKEFIELKRQDRLTDFYKILSVQQAYQVYLDLEQKSLLDCFVFEKYISNNKNYFYRVYKCFDNIVISRVIDKSLIKKMPEGIERENFLFTKNERVTRSYIPEAVESAYKIVYNFTVQNKVDYCTMDVIQSDTNEFYIIDVNVSPFWGEHQHSNMLSFLGSK